LKHIGLCFLVIYKIKNKNKYLLYKTMSHHKTYPLILSSNKDLGANTSDNGSKFDIQLKYPISVPKNATKCSIEVVDANIWYNFPNIKTNVNDQLHFIYSSINYVITFPTGLYDILSINDRISRELINLDLKSNLIQIGGDSAVGKAYFVFTESGIQLDFSQPRSIGTILGFDLVVNPLSPSTTSIFVIEAENIGRLNTVNSLLIHTDLVNTGIQTGNKTSQTIAHIPINVGVGSLINYTPVLPVHVRAENLINDVRRECAFWVTNELNQPIDTNGEDWSLTVLIRWEV
jgi:hypothetical protein